MFGLKSAQVDEVASIMSVVTRNWRELAAGSEGFLVGPGRAGLEDHAVVWGEMVSDDVHSREGAKQICLLMAKCSRN